MSGDTPHPGKGLSPLHPLRQIVRLNAKPAIHPGKGLSPLHPLRPRLLGHAPLHSSSCVDVSYLVRASDCFGGIWIGRPSTVNIASRRPSLSVGWG